jgi:hypothetical protein
MNFPYRENRCRFTKVEIAAESNNQVEQLSVRKRESNWLLSFIRGYVVYHTFIAREFARSSWLSKTCHNRHVMRDKFLPSERGENGEPGDFLARSAECNGNSNWLGARDAEMRTPHIRIFVSACADTSPDRKFHDVQ